MSGPNNGGGNGRLHKIALVAPYDYAYRGGVNTHISSLAQTYQDLGLDVRVIAACSNAGELPEHLIRASSHTLPIHYSGSTTYISLSPRAFGRIRDILRREEFDVIHVHEPLAPAIPISALIYSRSLNVGTFHAYRDSSLSFYQASAALRPIIERLDGRIAVSPAAREYISRYFPGDYVVIPNGIDYDRFAAPAEPIAQFADGRPNILYVGRLDKRKGFRYLLSAYEQVKRACPQVRLLAVGAFGPEEVAEHIEFAEDHRLPDVHFIGHVTDDALRRYYHTCDIVCVPSTGFESFGYVLIEAMAAGKPVVASDIPGYSFVMQHGRQGLFVPPEDSDALADALISLVRDPDAGRRLGEEGRRRAAEFSWHSVAKRVLDYYGTLTEAKRKREAECSPTS
ncbi:MAG: glycosyltransferase family 4 protein [Anaerolineae bacterium]